MCFCTKNCNNVSGGSFTLSSNLALTKRSPKLWFFLKPLIIRASNACPQVRISQRFWWILLRNGVYFLWKVLTKGKSLSPPVMSSMVFQLKGVPSSVSIHRASTRSPELPRPSRKSPCVHALGVRRPESVSLCIFLKKRV